MQRINQADYTHYVVLIIAGTPHIASGWSYAADAADDRRENARLYARHHATNVRIWTKRTCQIEGIDPNENASWISLPA